jgi:hypothetical protein
MAIQSPPGVQIVGPVPPQFAPILSVEAQHFIQLLERCFGERRRQLLLRRVTRQLDIDAGVPLGAFGGVQAPPQAVRAVEAPCARAGVRSGACRSGARPPGCHPSMTPR